MLHFLIVCLHTLYLNEGDKNRKLILFILNGTVIDEYRDVGLITLL